MSSVNFGMRSEERDSLKQAEGKRKTTALASSDIDERFTTKTCPRCGEEVFSDMPICYGCLYDFERNPEEVDWHGRSTNGIKNTPVDMSNNSPYIETSRHARHALGNPDETVVLSQLPEPGTERTITIETSAIDARFSVGTQGLSLGRSADNDIVLRLASISRQHAMIYPSAHGVTVLNKGATNPMHFRGSAVEDSVDLGEGDVLELGQALLRVGL